MHEDHPAPDPLILLANGAVNFTRRHGQYPSAPAPEPRDEEWDELDQMAFEDYLKRRKCSTRAPDNFYDLAAGLGQPDACRPDDWVENTTTNSSSHVDRGIGPAMVDIQALY